MATDAFSEGVWQTHEVFPAAILADLELPRPFVQGQSPSVLAAIPARHTSPYAGWIILNIAVALLTAAVIFNAVRHRTTEKRASLSAALFLVMPTTVYHASQPLSETFLAGLAAIAVYAYQQRNNHLRNWLILGTAIALLAWVRPAYLLLLPVLLVVAVRDYRVRRIRHAWVPLLASVGVALPWVASNLSDFGHAPCSISDLLSVNLVGDRFGGMFCYFTDASPMLSISGLASKAVAHSKDILVVDSVTEALFGLPVLLIVLALFVTWTSQMEIPELDWLTLAFIGVGVGIVLVFQYQVRYGQVLLPAIIYSAASLRRPTVLGLNNRQWTRRSAVAAAAATLLLVSGFTAYETRIDSRRAAERRAMADEVIQNVPLDDTVLLAWNSGSAIELSYILRPRSVRYISPQNTEAEIEKLANEIAANWLLAPHSDPEYAEPFSSCWRRVAATSSGWVLWERC